MMLNVNLHFNVFFVSVESLFANRFAVGKLLLTFCDLSFCHFRPNSINLAGHANAIGTIDSSFCANSNEIVLKRPSQNKHRFTNRTRRHAAQIATCTFSMHYSQHIKQSMWNWSHAFHVCLSDFIDFVTYSRPSITVL